MRHGSLGLLALILSLSIATARAAAPPIVGFVDVAYLIDNSPQSLKARERLESEFMPRQREVTELRGERDRVRSELAEVEAVDEAAKQRGELDLRAIERRLQRLEQAFREDLNIKRNNELKSVRDHVLESVTTFARQEGFDLILTDGVLFASGGVDVTQRVLKLLRTQP